MPWAGRLFQHNKKDGTRQTGTFGSTRGGEYGLGRASSSANLLCHGGYFFGVVPFGHRRHDMQRGLAHDCASVANLFLRFHLDSQCFPVGGRHDPVALFRVGRVIRIQTYLSVGNGFLYRRFAVLCLVRFVCPAGSFTHVARRGGSHGDEREWLFGTSDLSETPSGQRFRTECHGRGSGLRGRTYDIRCDFIRGLLAMAVCREFAVRRTDILFSP